MMGDKDSSPVHYFNGNSPLNNSKKAIQKVMSVE